jgi:hypothetical protein
MMVRCGKGIKTRFWFQALTFQLSDSYKWRYSIAQLAKKQLIPRTPTGIMGT